MFLLYVDEFGHSGPWNPNLSRFAHHPLFGLGGFAVEASRWRDLDRGFLRLKLEFYRNEIRKQQTLHGLRPERYEPKRLRSTRDKRFAYAVLKLVERCNGRVFAAGRLKEIGESNHREPALYTSTVQALIRQFEKFLRGYEKHRGQGFIVMDERHRSQNELVLASAQSYLFSGQNSGAPFERVIEVPLLVYSHWYHGCQAADAVGRVLAALFRKRALGDDAYQWAEKYFGELVDRLTHKIGRWRSVHILAGH